MAFNKSTVIIAPADRVDVVNTYLADAGWGEECISVSLNNGTFFGCEFRADEVMAATYSIIPTTHLNKVIVDEQTDVDAYTHWNEVLAANNLTVDEPVEIVQNIVDTEAVEFFDVARVQAQADANSERLLEVYQYSVDTREAAERMLVKSSKK